MTVDEIPQEIIDLLVDAKIDWFKSSMFVPYTPKREVFEKHIRNVVVCALAGKLKPKMGKNSHWLSMSGVAAEVGANG